MENKCYTNGCEAAKPWVRGQGAMEYLMNYGWAILVVLVVGIMLWQLGYLDMHAETMTVSGFSRLKPQLAGTRLTTTGDFEGTFTNAAGETVVIKDCTMTRDEDGATNSIATNGGDPTCKLPAFSWVKSTEACCAGNNLAACDASVAKGQNFVIHVAPPALGAFTGREGSAYKITATITYTATISGIATSHTDSGVIRATYQND